MLFSEGTRLGPYEITAPIGAGGMGEVYKAHDTRLDRTVAIKVLPSTLVRDAHARQRFAREARAIAALSHPHICPLFDIGHQEGADYLVMEFLEVSRWPTASDAAVCRSIRRCGTPSRSRRRSPPRTPRASSTATSSRATSCSRGPAR